jgi:signal peptidase I
MSSLAPSPDQAHALKCELAGEVLRSSGRLRLQVTGWSMLPTICPGDVLEIERARGQEVSRGDIVLYGRDRRLVVHRVVKQDSEPGTVAMTTRGDAMRSPDPPFSDEALMGRVAFISRSGRLIVPRKSLRISQRAVAALVQRSKIAARVVVGVHAMRRSSRARTSQMEASSRGEFPCQP